MRIDIHSHVFHPKIAGKILAQLENHYSIRPQGTGVVDDLLERLETASIDKAVVFTAATSPDQVIPANNWAMHLQETYEKLIPFGTLHPDFIRNEQELDRLEKSGIKGLKFHPDFQGFSMADNAFYETMEMISDRFICMFHVGDTLPPHKNPSCPEKLAKLKKSFPGTTMIAAHMGGYLHWEHALEHLADTEVLVDTSSAIGFLDSDLLGRLYDAFGSQRMLFGSDYPLFDPGKEMETLKSRLALSSTEFESILTNANGLFRSC